tara:strand:- start:591 stop:1190 length:600 start_codon:yes stop_codon:yes gene_type:complete
MISYIDIADKYLLLWVHKNHNTFLDYLMPALTSSDNWTIPIILLILFLGFRCGKKGRIALVIIVICLGTTDALCAQVLKPFFQRLRPSHLSIEGLNLLVGKGGKWSMPSNHAANIFALSTILSYFYERFKFPLYLFSVVIAISRVYVGVHYPSDILIGSFVGYLIGWTTISMWVILKIRELKRRRTWVWYESNPPKFKS